MMRSQTLSPGKGVFSPARPARNTVASAMIPLPALADVATITCTTTKGTVSCVDELGESVRGSRLKELQSILKPIAEAPALADAKQAAPKDITVKAPESQKAPAKEVSAKAPEAPKAVEARPVSDTPAPSKEVEAKAKPAVASGPAPEAKPAVATELKADSKPEAKSAVVADKKPAEPQVAQPAVSDATKPEAKPAVISDAPKPAAETKPTIVVESKPAPQTPPAPQAISGDAKPPAPQELKPAAPAEAPTPPAPTQAASAGTPAPQSTPSTPDATGPPASSKLAEAATANVSHTTPAPATNLSLQSPKSSNPTTLATPDLAPRSSGNEMRPRSVARGNDDSVSFSTGTARAGAAGNSSLGLDAPVSSATTPLRPTTAAGRFPGNVDPADFLPADFDNVITNVTPLRTATMTSTTKAKTFNVMNEKGLIPGNLPPELGDILQLVNAVNTTPVKNLDLRVYPGNVPPDGVAPTVLEFSPGNSSEKGKDVQAVKMQLTPGNVTPEIEDMLDFFGITPSAGA